MKLILSTHLKKRLLFLFKIYKYIHVNNVRFDLINSNLICTKYDEVSLIIKYMDLGALDILETCLTDTISDEEIPGDVALAGYSFHHAAQILKSVVKSAFFFMII